ncbi:hypothetical protein, partial [Komagataeibacter europaeus]|uniref:hypothetical protein n=1 Tax=Komagataeibacter europaeus TaxID=33995 RepID=UPI002231BEE8
MDTKRGARQAKQTIGRSRRRLITKIFTIFHIIGKAVALSLIARKLWAATALLPGMKETAGDPCPMKYPRFEVRSVVTGRLRPPLIMRPVCEDL